MATIRILPDNVVNKIAAGEVVERPESVVKELIENSLDAGSGSVKIYLKKSGKREIKVIDDGCGMDYDDAILAFERHATSKINAVEDIERIATLGFRGEALPSISSVSKIILKTKPKNREEGTIVKIEGGILKKVEKSPLPDGTEITVANLFFNTPARKRFLKSDQTELSRIVRLVNSYALANPSTAFHLYNDGKLILSFSTYEDINSRIRKILNDNFLSFKTENQDLKVEVFLLPPEKALKSPLKQYFLLNGRFVRDKTISRSVYSAFKSVTSFFEGYPQIVVKLQIKPELVDVNVHPSKLEVRFRKGNEVYAAIKETCVKALENRKSPSSIKVEGDKVRFFTKEQYSINEAQNSFVSEETAPYSTATRENNEYYLSAGFAGEQKDFRILGQFEKSYIVAERENSLYLIDQHVAHERILFEKAFSMIKNNEIEKQPLLIPITVNVGTELKTLVEEKRKLFSKCGFDFEFIDEKTAKIKAYPVFLTQKHIERSFLELIALIEDNRESESEELFRDIAASIGCKNAIKANTALSFVEMEHLLSELFSCENPFYCPHGRPILIKFTLSDIEKLFKRK